MRTDCSDVSNGAIHVPTVVPSLPDVLSVAHSHPLTVNPCYVDGADFVNFPIFLECTQGPWPPLDFATSLFTKCVPRFLATQLAQSFSFVLCRRFLHLNFVRVRPEFCGKFRWPYVPGHLAKTESSFLVPLGLCRLTFLFASERFFQANGSLFWFVMGLESVNLAY